MPLQVAPKDLDVVQLGKHTWGSAAKAQPAYSVPKSNGAGQVTESSARDAR